MPKKTAWGGIDPGLSGCACLLTNNKIWFHDFVNEQKAAALIDQWHHEYKVKFLLEKQVDVRKEKFNVPGKLLVNYGFWRGCMFSFDCNFVEMTPSQWRSKVMPPRRKTKETTKEQSLFYAGKYYPSVHPKLNLKKYHDRAEALLMAHLMKKIEIGA